MGHGCCEDAASLREQLIQVQQHNARLARTVEIIAQAASEPPAEGAEPFDAKEAAKRVYWRTCSRCGDVDRDSLSAALQSAYDAGAASLREQLKQQFSELERMRELYSDSCEENEELREALRKLAKGNRAPDVLAIAREALAGKESKNTKA